MHDTQLFFLASGGSEIKIYTKTPSLKTTHAVRKLASGFMVNPNIAASEGKKAELLDKLAEQGVILDQSEDSKTDIYEAVKQGKLKLSDVIAFTDTLSTEAPYEVQNHNETVTFEIFLAILDTTKNTEEERKCLDNREWLEEQDFGVIAMIVDGFFARAGMKKPA
jgi:hypothetical protein